jgi:hypothetical protein
LMLSFGMLSVAMLPLSTLFAIITIMSNLTLSTVMLSVIICSPSC